jgi:hypothetical protein
MLLDVRALHVAERAMLLDETASHDPDAEFLGSCTRCRSESAAAFGDARLRMHPNPVFDLGQVNAHHHDAARRHVPDVQTNHVGRDAESVRDDWDKKEGYGQVADLDALERVDDEVKRHRNSQRPEAQRLQPREVRPHA